MCIGLCISSSTGKVFGESGLGNYWFYFLVFPSALLFLRAIILFFFFRHGSPIYYQVKSEESKNDKTREKNDKKRDELLATFYKKTNDIVIERKRLENITTQLVHKKTEKSFKDLFYTNLISPRQRYAALAVIMFNFYAPIAGQAYSDSFTTTIFDKLVDKGFGFEVTFYSGFASLIGSTAILFIANKVGRRTIIVWSQCAFWVCM